MRLTRERMLFGIVMLAALVIRFWDLNARSLWFDEAGEYWVATAPFGALAQSVRTGTGDPPLYSYLLHLWLKLGSSTVWIRTLSVIASLAGVAGVMALARRVAGTRAAIAAGVMMAVLPADVRYAQEAGQYALMVAAVAWNLVALHRLWSSPAVRAGIVWALSALVASYAYYGAVLAVAAPFLCAAIEAAVRRDGTRIRAGLAGAGAYAVGILPLLLFILPAQMSRVVASDVSSTPPGTGFFGAVAAFFGQVLAFQFTGWPYTVVPAVIPVVAALLLIVFAARAHTRVLIWLAATWLVQTLSDVADIFPYGFRWGLILTPLLIACAAAGTSATGRWRRVATRAALACLVLGAAVSLPNRSLRDALYKDRKWPWPETEDMRGVLANWTERRAPSQPTYVYYGAAPAFAYYTRGNPWTRGLRSTWYLDCWHAANARCGDDNVRFGHWMRDANPTRRIADVRDSFGGWPVSLWLVFSHMRPNDDRDLVAALVTNGYRIDAVYQGADAAVFLLSRP